MKAIKLASLLSFLGIMMTACQKYAEVKPEFYDFRKSDEVSKEEFLEACKQEENSLDFGSFKYENKSFRRITSSNLQENYSFDYGNSQSSGTITKHIDKDVAYHHQNEVYFIDTLTGLSSSMPEGEISNDLKSNYTYQITNGNVVLVDKNNRIYEVIGSAASFTSFGVYIRKNHPLSATFLQDNYNDFYEFEKTDYKTRYYVTKGNIFTTAINYELQDHSVEGKYASKLTVTATAQIYVKNSNNITINTKYESTEVRTNFSASYMSENNIKYQAVTIKSNYLSTDSLTIGAIFIANSVDIKNFSHVDSVN